jgi:sec-independent protein translocase protein TatC
MNWNKNKYMSFFKEFKEFIKSILSWVCFLLGFSFFFFLFGLKEIEILGKNIFLPLPTLQSFSSQIFRKIQQDLLPSGVQLIVTNPLSAFLAQVLISLLLAFIITSPFFLYKTMKYLSPALFEKEKKVIIRVLFPSVFLFFLGCLFAYFLLIPSTFKALYPFAAIIGAIPFFLVNEFISLVFGLMLVSGIIFLLPVFMILLNSLGIVKADFWKNNWRYAFLIFLIFSAIITPDGTGITMLMLSAPLVGLYFAGCMLTSRFNKQIS